MGRNGSVLGSITIPSQVEILPDAVVVATPAANLIEHQLAAIRLVLQSFGPFSIRRELLPAADAFVVSVIATSPGETALFDSTAFLAHCVAMNRECAAAMKPDTDDAERAECVAKFAATSQVEPDKIRRCVEKLRRVGGIRLIDADGEAFSLGPTHRVSIQPEAWMDIDAGTVQPVMYIETDKGAFRCRFVEGLDIKPGDRVEVIDPEPATQERSITADAAIPVSGPSPIGLFH